MKNFLKSKWKEIVVIFVCVVLVVVSGILYAISTSRQIFEESSAHLEEVTEQINDKFKTVVQNNIDTLHAIKHHVNYSIDHLDTDEAKRELDKFFVSEQESRNLTDIIFIGEGETERDNGEGGTMYVIECKSALNDGGAANLYFKRSVNEVLKSQQSSMFCWDEENNIYLMFFVDYKIASDDCNHCHVYDGFSYRALGFLYNVKDMENLLEVETFDGKGIGYITRSDGMILVQVDSPRFSEGTNYLDFLGDGLKIDLNDSSIDKIRQDFANTSDTGVTDQRADTILIYDKEVKEEYYLTYQPVGFDDWMFIMLVPSRIINSSMSKFRLQTILVVSALFAAICAIVVWYAVLTYRRKIKAKERESEQAVQSRDRVFDLLSMGSNSIFIIFSHKDFTSTYVSPNVADVLGFDIETLKKDVRSLSASLVNRAEMFSLEYLEALPMASSKESDSQFCNINTKDIYWYHAMLYRTRYDDNSFVLVLSDRTKEHKMRDSLEDALAIAKSANEAKSNFLSNMSHDIRTPMNAVIGYATLLSKDADKVDKVREYVRKITFSSQHLLSLINDILDMSRIESGKTTLSLEDFDLPEMIEEIHSIIAPQAKAKKQEFTITTKGKTPNTVKSDKLRLKQVLINLLSNSVKYTPDGGHIQLVLETVKETSRYAHMQITVKDDGIGMSADYVKTIFEPFSREETTKAKSIQGTGLGMAITKSIVDLMGGSINVESEPNNGSTFTLVLKLKLAGRQTDGASFWSERNISRVLVVDNDEDVCINVRSQMENTGVAVDYATSGKQAVQKVRAAKAENANYQIILLDWKMPKMNGPETARQIRELVGDTVPIIVLTAYDFDDFADEAAAVGIDTCLSKPFFVSHFRNAVESLTASSASDGDKQAVSNMAGLRVLAAEDNEINAEILVELLGVENAECDVAVDGKAVLDKFESSEPDRYDVIFMDVQMPVMNGYEAATAIRKCKHPNAKTIPIIAMTANAFDDDVKAALSAGMNAHVAKPIDIDRLKSVIADLHITPKQNV
ncbi:MAG: response regulator [Clostridiales bacterium]|nr:response regulator [Clostridiales bacterium]